MRLNVEPHILRHRCVLIAPETSEAIARIRRRLLEQNGSAAAAAVLPDEVLEPEAALLEQMEDAKAQV